MYEQQETDTILLAILIIFMLFLIVMALCMNVLIPFIDKRNYIKMEMMRSDEDEYYYWKQELRNHYLEHIPILGWFIRRVNIKRNRY